jgi:pyridoxal phosphate enzyme (YggS family)
VEPARIREAVEAGVRNLGENYIQEAVEKIDELGPIARWHFIGHLQSNKVKPALERFNLIQSVDSRSLAEEIDKRARAMGRVMDVLIEVNLGDEESKFGVESEAALDLVGHLETMPGVRLQGFMGMAPIVETPDQARPYFAKLKNLWDTLPEENRVHLSMGMTADFEAAIQEGSNMVRIGTAIFGPRTY